MTPTHSTLTNCALLDADSGCDLPMKLKSSNASAVRLTPTYGRRPKMIKRRSDRTRAASETRSSRCSPSWCHLRSQNSGWSQRHHRRHQSEFDSPQGLTDLSLRGETPRCQPYLSPASSIISLSAISRSRHRRRFSLRGRRRRLSHLLRYPSEATRGRGCPASPTPPNGLDRRQGSKCRKRTKVRRPQRESQWLVVSRTVPRPHPLR